MKCAVSSRPQAATEDCIRMTDVSLAGAFLAGLVSFLSPCVLPLVPGYISMLSGVGMEQLRKGEVPSSSLLGSSLSFIAGFSVVFISFGASASAVGVFLKQNRNALTPIAGALILLFGLHLLGLLIKLNPRAGTIFGAILVALAFAFGWTPCIGPILTTVLTIAAASDKIQRGVLLLAVYSAGLAIPFLLTALGIGKFMTFYKNFRKYLHAVELFSGALLLFIGGLVFVNKLTWLTAKLSFLNVIVLWLEHVLTRGRGGTAFWLLAGVAVAAVVVLAVIRRWEKITSMQGSKTILAVTTVIALIIGTYYADKATRVKATGPENSSEQANDKSIGQPAPEVTFKDLDGKDATLTQYKGKVVLVNFWATWCEPCYVEIPWLIEMQQKYEAKGFMVLGISMDDEGKSAVAPFLAKERFNVNGQKLPMNYPIVIGSDDVADKFGGLLGYPTSFLISRDGKIVKKVQGLISYEELTKAIESQL